jgi:hypothetical protein
MTYPGVRKILMSGVPGILFAGVLGGSILGGGVLGGCATQSATSQALTIVGAAAVVVGASMAAGDGHCQDSGSPGSPLVHCSPGLSKGARQAGTATAVVGAGLAAAGYALEPKGPDTLQPAQPSAAPVPGSPYRLVRPPLKAAPEASSGLVPTPPGGEEPEPGQARDERPPVPPAADNEGGEP